MITLPILDEAITELEWVLERGAKIILVRPAPANGLRGPWSIALAGVRPVLGSGAGGRHSRSRTHVPFPPLTTYYETWEPGNSDSAFKPSPAQGAAAAAPGDRGRHRRDDLLRARRRASPTYACRASRTGRPGSATCNASSTPRTGRCPRSSPSTPWTCFDERVRQPVLGGRRRGGDRVVWARPRALRLRLSAPRGSCGTARLPRHAPFRTPRRRHHPSGDEHERERAARPPAAA